MTTTNGFVPTEKMLDPTTLAEMLRISDRHLADVRREDATFPAPKMLGTLSPLESHCHPPLDGRRCVRLRL